MTFMSRRRKQGTRPPTTARVRARRGMTLVEVTISMVILAGVALGMGAFVSQYSRSASAGNSRTVAVEMAAERIEEVRRATRYDSLETKYAGTEASITGRPGFTRTTAIRRMGGGTTDPVDYKLVTVTVNPPNGAPAVKKTTAISTF